MKRFLLNRKRGGIKVFSLIFIVFFTMGAGLVFWPGFSHSTIEIDVLQGQTAGIIGKHLEEKELIRSVPLFKFWVKILRVENKIAVGRYRLNQGQSSFWIVQKLVQGDTFKVRVIIPEGYSSWQIAERLENLNITKRDEFLNWVKTHNLEGYLFPATYDLDIGLGASHVATLMTKEFERRWSLEFAERSAALGLNQKEVVVLASIVEREVKMRDELPLIASLYLNRFKKGMKLEADPTVQYALGEWRTRLTY
ncbi:MAG: endolytic transglycosylase MltG, partial [Elusimicrobiota bacterium]